MCKNIKIDIKTCNVVIIYFKIDTTRIHSSSLIRLSSGENGMCFFGSCAKPYGEPTIGHIIHRLPVSSIVANVDSLAECTLSHQDLRNPCALERLSSMLLDLGCR